METLPQNNSSDSAEMEGRYLTFVLHENHYAVPIIRVQEIIGLCPITTVPKSRPYLLGIMNLRGKVIPVVELRALLGLHQNPHTEKTCFVVVHSNIAGEQLSCGFVVDQVNEVVDLSGSEITETNQGPDETGNRFLMGFGKSDAAVAMLLNVDAILTQIVSDRRVGFSEK